MLPDARGGSRALPSGFGRAKRRCGLEGGVPSFVLVVVGIGAGKRQAGCGRRRDCGGKGASCLRRSREKRNLGSAGPADLGGLMVGHTRFGWTPAGVGSLGSADCRVVAGGESGSRAKSGMDGWIAKAIPGKWHGLAGMARRVGRDEKPPGEFYIKRADLIRPGGWKGLEERSPTHFVNAPSQTRNERRGPADW
jgi:hypothetical protein